MFIRQESKLCNANYTSYLTHETGLQRLCMETKGRSLCENVGVRCRVAGGDMVITCAALGNNGLVTAGCTAGAAGRLGRAPAAGAGAM